MRNEYFVRAALAGFICVSLLFTTSASAHTFHTSLMQVEYNAEEQTVEIAIQVFAHDLESVLTKRAGRTIRLDRSPDASQLILSYIREAVTIRNGDGKTKELSWVGMEPQADAVWLYVETKMPEGLAGAQVRDRIFFDLLQDQVNLVHVKFEGKKADLVFKPGEDFKPIVYAEPEK